MSIRTIAVLLALVSVSAAGDTLVPQKAPPIDADRPQTSADCDRECTMRVQVDRHLALIGDIGNEKEQQASLRELVALGPPVVRVVNGAYNHWSRITTPDEGAPARPGEMRWRAAYLLGVLGFPDAKRLLYDIARREDPDPRKSEIDYADEYRVKLRAVAGLEQLKAVEELKALHERGGTLSNATAAALFELGVNVGGVSRVDARTALADDRADPADYKPNKGRPAQPDKPGSQGFKVKPRSDTPALGRREE